MSDKPQIPAPGTDEAVARGCTCDYRDGEPEDNDRWPDWITTGCPLHDSTPQRPGVAKCPALRRR